MSQYRDLIDSMITRASYGANMSDIENDLVNAGVTSDVLPNIIRLINWEARR